MAEPTIEEMQAELIQLRSDKEALIAKVQSDAEKLTETENALRDARAINGKLISQMPVIHEKNPIAETAEPEPHKETVDEFCDSFIRGSVKQLKKIYGSDKVADFD